MSYYPNAPYPAPIPMAVPLPVVQIDPPRVTSEEGPAAEKPRGPWPTRYAKAFGIVIIVLTGVAIALAAVAPLLAGASSPSLPKGWTTLYDGLPQPGQWSNAAGCDYSGSGLLITGNAATENCLFLLSRNRDLVSSGFYVEATLGPAADVAQTEDGGILVGARSDALAAVVDQSGAYRLCTLPCVSGAIYATGKTDAWHAGGYTPNVIGLRYEADSHTATLYVNGQAVRSVTYTPPPSSEIALAASRDAQVLITHVAVSAAGS